MAQQQTKEDIELKERLDPSLFKEFIRRWADALERQEDMTVVIHGEQCHIPYEAFATAKLEAEYEIEDGEYEFELKMKWIPE